MSKFKTVSGSEINYKATEVKVTPTYEVEVESDFIKDNITVRAEKENLESAIEYALEGKNSMFRKSQKEAQAKITEEEEAKLIAEGEEAQKKLEKETK